MKKLVYTLIALMVLTVFMVGCTTVVPETDLSRKGPNGQAGNSNIAHLYLYEKIPGPIVVPPIPWDLVEGGAWGKMKYNQTGETFDFVFNGHGLVADQEYCLIYYEDPGFGWPNGMPNIYCLGMGTANAGGEVHIADSATPGTLPWVNDINEDGAKIWLVLSADVDCDNQLMIGWNPTEYLFEGELITFTEEQKLLELNKKHKKLTSELTFRGQFFSRR